MQHTAAVTEYITGMKFVDLPFDEMWEASSRIGVVIGAGLVGFRISWGDALKFAATMEDGAVLTAPRDMPKCEHEHPDSDAELKD